MQGQPKIRVIEEEPRKLHLIPQIYGWIIVAMGFVIFLIMVPMGFLSLYYEGLSLENLFGTVMLVIEGIALGGGFVAFGTALRGFLAVQATLCFIIMFAALWLTVFFWAYGEISSSLMSLGIGSVITAPLALNIIIYRKEFRNE